MMHACQWCRHRLNNLCIVKLDMGGRTFKVKGKNSDVLIHHQFSLLTFLNVKKKNKIKKK